MRNIKNEIPEVIKINNKEYKFIKKYNDNNYLYKEVRSGFYECFGVQDLGLIIGGVK